MSFPKGLPPTTVRVHPTQLYEIAGTLVIFAILQWVVSPRFKREGPLMFAYAILAGIARFLVEFIRTNPKVAWGLTQQQFIAIAMFVVGIAGVWWFETHGKLRPTPAMVAAEFAAAKSPQATKTASSAKTTNASKTTDATRVAKTAGTRTVAKGGPKSRKAKR